MHARVTVATQQVGNPNDPIQPPSQMRKPSRWSGVTSTLNKVREKGKKVSSGLNGKMKSSVRESSKRSISEGTAATEAESAVCSKRSSRSGLTSKTESNSTIETRRSPRPGFVGGFESQNTLSIAQSNRTRDTAYVQPIIERLGPDDTDAFETTACKSSDRHLAMENTGRSWGKDDFSRFNTSFNWAKKIHEEEVPGDDEEQSISLSAVLDSSPKHEPSIPVDDMTIETTASARVKTDRRTFLLQQPSDTSLEADLESTPRDENKPWRKGGLSGSSHHSVVQSRKSLSGALKIESQTTEDSIAVRYDQHKEDKLVGRTSELRESSTSTPNRRNERRNLQRAQSERSMVQTSRVAKRRPSLSPIPTSRSPPRSAMKQAVRVGEGRGSRKGLKRAQSERMVVTGDGTPGKPESSMHREFISFLREDSKRNLFSSVEGKSPTTSPRRSSRVRTKNEDTETKKEAFYTPTRSPKRSGRSRRDAMRKQVSTPCFNTHAGDTFGSQQTFPQPQPDCRPSLHNVFEWSTSQRKLDTEPKDPQNDNHRNTDLFGSSHTRLKMNRRQMLQRSYSTTSVQQFHVTRKWPPEQPNRKLHSRFYDKSIRVSSRDLKKTEEKGIKTVSAATMLQIMEPVSKREIMTLFDREAEVTPPTSSDDSVVNYSDVLDNMSLISGGC